MERVTRKETIVVRGKETAACNYENDDCNDQCRYGACRWQEKANMLLKEYEDTGLTTERIRELAERDTAKAPVDTDDEFDMYVCPSCDMAIVTMGDKRAHNFCLNCGQRLKWEEGARC